jgi:hypothetical protein
MFILPVLTYGLFLLIYLYKKKNLTESVVVSWLFVTLCTWVIVEMLSSFRLLNTPMVFVSWSVIGIALTVYAARQQIIQNMVKDYKSKRHISGRLGEHKWDWLLLFAFCSIVCLLAVLRSQNLVDNLHHRLTKIMHWIQNEGVGYFATVTPQEIQYTQLTEYMNAQIYLLKGSDRFINLVQAGAYICSGGCIYGIGRKLGASQRFARLSVWIYLLTPMVIIEVLTTQTDVVAGSYLLAFIYILIDFIQAKKLVMDRQGALAAACLSASVLFGYLAKPTVCFCMVIFFLWMCVVRIVKKDRFVTLLQYALIGGGVALTLFLPSGIRRYEYDHSSSSLTAESGAVKMANSDTAGVQIKPGEVIEIVSTDNSSISVENGNSDTGEVADQIVEVNADADRILSGMKDPREFMVVSLRNLAANSTSRCFPKVNDLLRRVVEKCESMLNYTGGYRYFRVMVEEGFGETSEPSPAVMFFLLVSWICVILRISRITKEQALFFLCATVALILQSGMMGYTWYRQRYLMGAMAVLCPVFGVVLERISVSLKLRMNAAVAMTVIAGFGAANMITYEIPYIVYGFQGEKIHQYLIHDSDTELYYKLLLEYVNEHGYRNVGMGGIFSYEYILWQGIDDLERMEHVNVNPDYFLSAGLEDMEFIPECVVVETPEYVELGEMYYCHHTWYVCDWRANSESGRNFAVMVPWVEEE